MMEPTENIANYKFGLIYFNKNDRRFIVPKRNKGLGWTFNFGHKRSYLVLLFILCIPFLIHFSKSIIK